MTPDEETRILNGILNQDRVTYQEGSVICGESFSEERALFGQRGLTLDQCIFEHGESPLKHTEQITMTDSLFRWKYPLWYAAHIRLKKCTLDETARAGIWYSEDLLLEDCMIEAPKTFRKCTGLSLHNVSIPNAEETLWNCGNVLVQGGEVNGDYFGMNLSDSVIHDLSLYGNYSFDGAKNVEFHNCRLISKDCVWNAEHVTFYDCFISGEYFAWNSKDVTLVNCTIESLQGLCYIENLKMVNCRTRNTTLAFEYSTVDVEIRGSIESVFNPAGGSIRAGQIGRIVLDETQVDPAKTKIQET